MTLVRSLRILPGMSDGILRKDQDTNQGFETTKDSSPSPEDQRMSSAFGKANLPKRKYEFLGISRSAQIQPCLKPTPLLEFSCL